eukprot:SAG31_NODE_23686_length_498_cov_1.488722_1_plen_42_part_10
MGNFVELSEQRRLAVTLGPHGVSTHHTGRVAGDARIPDKSRA